MANVHFLYGTQAAYDALASKDMTTFYYTTDENNFYLGSLKLSEDGSSLPDVSAYEDGCVLITKDGDWAIEALENSKGADGVGISSLVQTTASTDSGGENVWTATLTDGTASELTVYNGEQGEPGETGNGIASITQTANSTASGGANTWLISMTDGSNYTFTVYNGAAGEGGSSSGSGSDGIGIASIVQTTTSTESGGQNVITITLTDGSYTTFNVYNGAKGDPGEDGDPGASAYEVAAANGYTGTEEEWLESLKGTDGSSAYVLAVENGFLGTEEDWLDSLQGNPGKDGDDGLSAYEVAVNNGYSGTEAEWIESLKGTDGDPGAKGDPGDDGVGIASLEQTTSSTASGGTNVWTATLTNNESYDFTVTNGTNGTNGTGASIFRTIESLSSSSTTASLGSILFSYGDDLAGTVYDMARYIFNNGGTALLLDSNDNLFLLANTLVNDSTAGVTYLTNIKGSSGVGISKIEQTTASTVSGEANVWTITLTDGTVSNFTVYNGAKGTTTTTEGTGTTSGLPDAANYEDGCVLVTSGGEWVVAQMG